MTYAIRGNGMSEDEAAAAAMLALYDAGHLDGGAFVGAAPSLLTRGLLRPATRDRVSNILNAMSSGNNRMLRALGPSVARNIETVSPGPIREVVQGIGTTTAVASGAEAIISVNATMLFKPTRLMIGPSVASFFSISDFRVANDSLFLNAGGVPGEVFLPESVGASALKRRTAQPGTPVSVIVRNLDTQPHSFLGAIFGEAADFDGCAS